MGWACGRSRQALHSQGPHGRGRHGGTKRSSQSRRSLCIRTVQLSTHAATYPDRLASGKAAEHPARYPSRLPSRLGRRFSSTARRWGWDTPPRAPYTARRVLPPLQPVAPPGRLRTFVEQHRTRVAGQALQFCSGTEAAGGGMHAAPATLPAEGIARQAVAFLLPRAPCLLRVAARWRRYTGSRRYQCVRRQGQLAQPQRSKRRRKVVALMRTASRSGPAIPCMIVVLKASGPSTWASLARCSRERGGGRRVAGGAACRLGRHLESRAAAAPHSAHLYVTRIDSPCASANSFTAPLTAPSCLLPSRQTAPGFARAGV